MLRKDQLTLATLLGIALLSSSCGSAPRVEADARAALRTTANKLKRAQTLQVSGTRVSDPALLPAGFGRETATYEITVVRPGKLAFKVSDRSGARRIVADGRHLTLTDDTANVYYTIDGKGGTIDDVAREIEKRFEYQPIGLEMLGADPLNTLLDGVTSAKVVGDEPVGGTPCRRLSFVQRGLQWDLWIATGDLLPRQLAMVFTGRPGRPRRTVTMDQWILNSVVPRSDFVFTPRQGARKADIIPAH